jgi:hypothetical protein
MVEGGSMNSEEKADFPGCECIAQVDKPRKSGNISSVLVKFPADGKRAACVLWVPFSIICAESEVFLKGNKGKLVVPLWWAEKGKLL